MQDTVQEKNQSEDTGPKDSIANITDTTKKLDSTAKITPEVKLKMQNETSGYYLIRGGFEEEENVKEYMNQLKAEGVESFVAGKTGRLILVGIGKFDTEDDAMKALNTYARTKPDWKLWVYKAK